MRTADAKTRDQVALDRFAHRAMRLATARWTMRSLRRRGYAAVRQPQHALQLPSHAASRHRGRAIRQPDGRFRQDRPY
jgi:hypothetical protein